jgi:cytochrome P450
MLAPADKFAPGPRSWIPGKIAVRFRRDVLGYLTQLQQEYGDVVAFNPLFRPIYVFYHPDAVREVLVTKDACFIKGPALRQAKDMLGEGLLTSEGAVHARQRRLAQPAFHPQRVATYAAAMVEYAGRMGRAWRDGQVLDAHEQMMQLTLEVVSKTLFDAEVASEVSAIGAAMDVSVRMFTRAMMPFGWVLNFLPLASNLRFWRARAFLNRVIAGFVRQRRESGVDRGDLLSMLLRATDAEGDGAGMSDKLLRDECITLFSAGHETTANALTFTWYLLARHPEVEAKLHAELAEVLAGGRPPTVEDVPRLTYTRAVLSESMRLYPPAWAIGREVATACEIGGYPLRRGTVVLVSQWVTHRDERFWPQASEFRPERWMAEGDGRPRYAYFPFGGGTRSCIGESFAWMEATLILATLAQRWRMELTGEAGGELQVLPTITLRPRQAVPVRVLERR